MQMASSKEWLTLSEAAQMLGIHPTTLRRWADHGAVPVKVTPGGHRRFLRDDLVAFVNQRQLPQRINSGQVWGDYALVETRRRLLGSPEPRWLAVFSTEHRGEERALGRRLMSLIIQHISAPDDDQDLLVEAKSIAVHYAQTCVQAQLTAAESLEATTFFRDTMTEVAIQMPQVAQLEGEAQLRLLRKINQIFNVVQVTVVECYDNLGR
jgi:excisionase family DNA binding protein